MNISSSFPGRHTRGLGANIYCIWSIRSLLQKPRPAGNQKNKRKKKSRVFLSERISQKTDAGKVLESSSPFHSFSPHPHSLPLKGGQTRRKKRKNWSHRLRAKRRFSQIRQARYPPVYNSTIGIINSHNKHPNNPGKSTWCKSYVTKARKVR